MTQLNIPVHSSSTGARRTRGFTLIELVITMLIAAMLAAIAIPAYSNYVRKARRAEVKSALLDLASLEERFYSTSNAYSSNATDLGYSAWPTVTPSGYYSIATPTVVAAVAPTVTIPAGTPATFSFVATTAGDQTKDTQCASFTVTSGGGQSALNSAGADNTQTCWR